MIKVKKMGWGSIRPPSWFIRELKLIYPLFDVIWLENRARWAIITPQPANVFRRGYFIEHIVEQRGKYAPLDGRVLRALRQLMYEKNRLRTLDKYLDKIDEEEKERSRAAAREQAYMETDFMKKVHKFQHSKTFT